MAAGPSAVLVALQAHQAGTHAGLPGGLGAAMGAPERAELLTFARYNKPKDLQDSCSVGPDQPNAHDLMSKFIVKLMNRLIASMYYLKELKKLALDWLADQFTGRASDQWEIVIREAAAQLPHPVSVPTVSCIVRFVTCSWRTQRTV